MKKICILILLAILFSSCSTYLDKGENIHTDFMDFNYMESYNEFLCKSQINGRIGNDTYYKTHFSIKLPKKIKNWDFTTNKFYFEYDEKEIIYLNVGYKNRGGNAGAWIIREAEQNDIYKELNSYWDERKYNEDILRLPQKGRISKIYSDGKVSILLYNIKKENFDKYLELVKSFEYLNL